MLIIKSALQIGLFALEKGKYLCCYCLVITLSLKISLEEFSSNNISRSYQALSFSLGNWQVTRVEKLIIGLFYGTLFRLIYNIF